MGYPGQFEHEYQDARTLAEWGVEFWKYDQCWHKFPLLDILAVEAYHAALVRTALYARGLNVASLRTAADSISNLRDSVDGSTDLDQGISPTTQSGNLVSNIVPLDSNGLAFSRTPAQTLNVVYLNRSAVSSGGFFPAGINNGNAAIRTSGAN